MASTVEVPGSTLALAQAFCGTTHNDSEGKSRNLRSSLICRTSNGVVSMPNHPVIRVNQEGRYSPCRAKREPFDETKPNKSRACIREDMDSVFVGLWMKVHLLWVLSRR